MKKEWDVLDVLKHSRHDWLNVIQLIKGNLALKKYDRLDEIIQEVVVKTQSESKLSNLYAPQFASRILVFNWEGHSYQVEFEVEGKSCDLSRVDQPLTEFFTRFTEVLDECCECYGENHLMLTIQLTNESSPRLIFDFQGSILHMDKLKEKVENKSNWNETMDLEELYINNDGVYLVIKIIT